MCELIITSDKNFFQKEAKRYFQIVDFEKVKEVTNYKNIKYEIENNEKTDSIFNNLIHQLNK